MIKSFQSQDGTIIISIEVADTGTGLGLALSNRLAVALGGTIIVDKYELGVGCTFVINFVAMIGKELLKDGKKSASECFKIPDAQA